MKEYLQEKFQELIDEYLVDNCSQVEEKVPYGDTEKTVSVGYSESDQVEAEVYAMDKLEEVLFDALNELKKENGFEVKEVQELVEKAKEVVSGL